MLDDRKLEQERKEYVEQRVRRALSIKAFREIQRLVGDYQEQEVKNKNFIKIFIGAMLLIIIIMVVVIINSDKLNKIYQQVEHEDQSIRQHIRSQADIDAVIFKYREIIFERFINTSDKNNPIKGYAIFKITVSAGGKVTKVDIMQSSFAGRISEDVAEIIRKMDFGESSYPGGDFQFTYPIYYHPPTNHN